MEKKISIIKTFFVLSSILLSSLPALSQNRHDPRYHDGCNPEYIMRMASSGDIFQEFECQTDCRNSATKPGSCDIGMTYWDTDDNELCLCDPANTWDCWDFDSSAGTIVIKEDGSTVVATTDTFNFTEPDATLITESPAGTGLFSMTGYALLAGRSGGQILKGGTAASQDLSLQSTAHATRGYIRALDHIFNLNDKKVSWESNAGVDNYAYLHLDTTDMFIIKNTGDDMEIDAFNIEIIAATPVLFRTIGIGLEGSVNDAFEHFIQTDNPSADRTINFPDDSLADDDVLMGDGANSLAYITMPLCADTDGQHLNWTGTAYACGVSLGGLSSHNHTSTANDGGVLTNDEHDGYTLISDTSAPSTPASGKVATWSLADNAMSQLWSIEEEGEKIQLTNEEVVQWVDAIGSDTLAAGSCVIVRAITCGAACGSPARYVVGKADQDISDPAIGVVIESIIDEGFGRMLLLGDMEFDTSAWVLGDRVYCGDDGVLTNAKPTGLTQYIHHLGWVAVDAVAGTITVHPSPMVLVKQPYSMLAGRMSASVTADTICHPNTGDCGTANQTRGVEVSRSGFAMNLICNVDVAQDVGDACSIIVRKATNCTGAFSNTALRCDFTTATRIADTTNAPTFSAGDCLDISFDETANTCSGTWSWAFELTISN